VHFDCGGHAIIVRGGTKIPGKKERKELWETELVLFRPERGDYIRILEGGGEKKNISELRKENQTAGLPSLGRHQCR